MLKRVALFLATNLPYWHWSASSWRCSASNANQFGGLLVMAALFGFGGSLISLLMSKWIAKRATGAHVIDTPRNEAEQWLLATVKRQAQAAGIGMPEVAIYDAPEINAFATGANRNKALVAVSHRPAARDGSRRGRSRARPRSQPRGQRRHGHAWRCCRAC